MYLTSSNLVYYLVGRGTVTRSSVVDGDFLVHELDCRNGCFKVPRRDHPSLFIKQIKVIDATNIEYLEREATCYRLARTDVGFAALSQIMPRFVDHDATRHVTIVELLPTAEDLRDCHRRLGTFPVEVGDLLGRRLGRFHADTGRTLSEPARSAMFARNTPWVLSVHEGSHIDSDASAQVTATIRQDLVICRALDAIRNSWQRDTLIHGDMKWDNCIVFLGPTGELDLRVVDWEMADHGDSAWDVGSIIQSYWSHAILRALPGTETTAEKLIDQAIESLHAIRPAVVALWKAYRQARAFDHDASHRFLDRCLRCAAARMIQTTYEYVGARGQLIQRAAAILQVGCDILRNSTQSAPWLIGREAESV
jgi:hypothetical protein